MMFMAALCRLVFALLLSFTGPCSPGRTMVDATARDGFMPVTNPATTAPAITVPSTNPTTPGGTVTVPSTTPVTVVPNNPTLPPATIPPLYPVPTPSTTIPATTPYVGMNPAAPLTNPATNPTGATYPSVTAPATSVPGTMPVSPAVVGAGVASWCVARMGAGDGALQSALDYACSSIDCSAIQPLGSCYDPNTLQSHASYAFNSYYQRNPSPANCDFGGAGMLVSVNPSSGTCLYQSSSGANQMPTYTNPAAGYYPSPQVGGGVSPVTAAPVTTPGTTPSAVPSTVPVSPVVSGQTWCIARTGVPDTALQNGLDYACGAGGVDCSAIQPTGSCYNPNTLMSHASYAFNSFYQRNPSPASCDFGGAGVTVNANPSFGSCVFQASYSLAGGGGYSPAVVGGGVASGYGSAGGSGSAAMNAGNTGATSGGAVLGTNNTPTATSGGVLISLGWLASVLLPALPILLL